MGLCSQSWFASNAPRKVFVMIVKKIKAPRLKKLLVSAGISKNTLPRIIETIAFPNKAESGGAKSFASL